MAITSYSLGIFIILSCRLVHKCNALEMGAGGGRNHGSLITVYVCLDVTHLTVPAAVM